MGTGKRHTRFCEVSLDRIDIFWQRFVRFLLETGVRNFGVLVRDQTTVLVEVIISHPCVKEARNFGMLVRDQTTVLVEVMTSNPCVEKARNFEK